MTNGRARVKSSMHGDTVPTPGGLTTKHLAGGGLCHYKCPDSTRRKYRSNARHATSAYTPALGHSTSERQSYLHIEHELALRDTKQSGRGRLAGGRARRNPLKQPTAKCHSTAESGTYNLR